MLSVACCFLFFSISRTGGPMFTHTLKNFCWSSTNHQAFALYCLSATEIWQRVLGTGYWVLVPFDAVWASYLIYPSEKRKTCSHAACLNFPLVSRFAFVVSVNCRILKTHKIALCLPCQYSSYPLHRPAFFFFVFWLILWRKFMQGALVRGHKTRT